MQPSEAKGIKILVVDDHPVVRKGLIFCLCRCDGLVLVGEAADGKEALQRARELHPEVILMDIDLPQVNGLAVTEELRRELPGIKVLVLSVHTESEYVLRAIRAGARGFISKHASVEELQAAILKVHAGETAFSPEVARVALNQFVRGNGLLKTGVCQITNREREVLVQIAEGLSNKEIASVLNVGVRTVETHRERIMRKLNIHSVAGLTRYAISHGLITVRRDV